MKYLDYAAMGAASSAYAEASSARAEANSAYAEASRARAEVAALWEENQRLRDDIDSQKYEREFQKWAEELIYQFSKVVKAIETSPAKPTNDFIDLASFIYLIEEKKLDTSLISGFEQKEKFDETLMKAQNLIAKLETNQEVQKYIREQEAARRERERHKEAVRLQEERIEAKAVRKAEADEAHAHKIRRILYATAGFALIVAVYLAVWDGKPKTKTVEVKKAQESQPKIDAQRASELATERGRIDTQKGPNLEAERGRTDIQKAAEQGNVEAQMKLAYIYYNGVGIRENAVKAAEWYTRAAEQGNVEAQMKLAFMYHNGIGVQQNYTNALKWYQTAATKGNENARSIVQQLEKKLYGSSNRK